MAYPASVMEFTTKVVSDTFEASYINDLQTEVVAVETDLLSAWTSVSHSAGNFVGSGSMTWTVAVGDQTTFAYRKVGKTMTVSVVLVTTSVGGVLGGFLQIVVPGGFTVAKETETLCHIIDNGVASIGLMAVGGGDSFILLTRLDGSDWSASTNQTAIAGQITFETTA